MSEQIRYFPDIQIEFPEKEIFYRLGGHLQKTQSDTDSMIRIRKCACHAFDACHPQGRYIILSVSSFLENGITLENGMFLEGKTFAGTCRGCSFLWCAAVTVGREITDLRDAAGSVAEKSILDAVASESADAAMDILHMLAQREILRSGRFLADRRYSAGYGDMPLSAQRITDSFLHLQEMGITLNEQNYMIPEKSVTAWADIRNAAGKRS